jgi:RNA polymerase sigma factor (sigma-70 family)
MKNLSGSAPESSTRSDAHLLHAARTGDLPSLGLLLERHRPQLFALALGILGHRKHDDIEDLVQDTFLQALRKLSQLQNPAAFGWWIRAIMRNTCYQYLRRPRLKLEVLDSVPEEYLGENVSSCVDYDGLRDEVWAALEVLPEDVRTTLLLRHFSNTRAYADIAAALGVPVGTVRSRLHQGRSKLAAALRAAASRSGGAILERLEARSAELKELLVAFYAGESRAFFSLIPEDLVVRLANGPPMVGRSHLEREFEEDLRAGMRLQVDQVLASGSISVVEGHLLNPPHEPERCPPEGTLLIVHRGDKIGKLSIHMASRLSEPTGRAT